MSETTKIEIYHINLKQKSTEEIPVPDGITNLKKYFEEMIKEFNQEERRRKKENPEYLLDLRKFIRVIGKTGERFCDFRKHSVFSQEDRNGIYDVIKCLNCGLEEKRYRIDSPSRRPCHPDRVCLSCNKLFASVQNLERHNLKAHCVQSQVKTKGR